MKKLATTVFIVLLALSACKKNDSLSATVTTDEAADLMAGTISTNSNGFMTASADILISSQAIYDLNIGCGATKNYTITHQSAAGASPSYGNTFAYNYTLNCNPNGLPDNVTGGATDNGSFDGPRLSSTNAGVATFRVAGLTPSASVYVLNGEYKRNGSFTSKIGSKSTSTTTIDVIVSNLTISKTTKTVVSGTATITVTGATSKNIAISFAGNLTFNNDGTASVTINGSLYTVDLITGAITKK